MSLQAHTNTQASPDEDRAISRRALFRKQQTHGVAIVYHTHRTRTQTNAYPIASLACKTAHNHSDYNLSHTHTHMRTHSHAVAFVAGGVQSAGGGPHPNDPIQALPRRDDVSTLRPPGHKHTTQTQPHTRRNRKTQSHRFTGKHVRNHIRKPACKSGTQKPYCAASTVESHQLQRGIKLEWGGRHTHMALGPGVDDRSALLGYNHGSHNTQRRHTQQTDCKRKLQHGLTNSTGCEHCTTGLTRLCS